MGTSSTYKTIRLLSHVLALLVILGNVFLLIVFIWENSFFKIENALNLGAIDMQVCYKYTIVTNIMLGLFASCAINSKVKYFIKVYLIAGFLGLVVLLSFFLFLLLPYKNLFIRQFALQMGINIGIKSLTRGLLDCVDYGEKECTKVAIKIVDRLVFIYFMVAGCSFFFNFVVYVMARFAMFVEPNTPRRLEPVMERNVQVGYDSVSLRSRRFIDPNVRFERTALGG